ncbi:hypothetical protein C0V97_13925 [Asaia sp. W19]|nr:hypothetical protein C0V97_13925 [Asaia sp. W19]
MPIREPQAQKVGLLGGLGSITQRLYQHDPPRMWQLGTSFRVCLHRGAGFRLHSRSCLDDRTSSIAQGKLGYGTGNGFRKYQMIQDLFTMIPLR